MSAFPFVQLLHEESTIMLPSNSPIQDSSVVIKLSIEISHTCAFNARKNASISLMSNKYPRLRVVDSPGCKVPTSNETAIDSFAVELAPTVLVNRGELKIASASRLEKPP